MNITGSQHFDRATTYMNEWVATERRRTERNRLAEAFIAGLQRGADQPDVTGDGDAMYQAFRDWIDRDD